MDSCGRDAGLSGIRDVVIWVWGWINVGATFCHSNIIGATFCHSVFGNSKLECVPDGAVWVSVQTLQEFVQTLHCLVQDLQSICAIFGNGCLRLGTALSTVKNTSNNNNINSIGIYIRRCRQP